MKLSYLVFIYLQIVSTKMTETEAVMAQRNTFSNEINLLMNSSEIILGDRLVDRVAVCYTDLGCLLPLNSSWFNIIFRPFNFEPESREKINTTFTLHTGNNPKGVVISAKKPETITAAMFKVFRKTKIIIHGYIADGYEKFYNDVVNSLLENGDYNVVVTHWGPGAFTAIWQAAANIRVVGLEVAYLVNTLVTKLGVNVSHVHLIGHSLGAHAAGYAGEKISNLGRITGLDPSNIFFRTMPTFVRLDPSDAQFVDVLHTDAGALGNDIVHPVGHLDFYANGGENQPGCALSDYFLNQTRSFYNTTLLDVLSCNHMRALRLFTDSLVNQTNDCHHYIGYECSSLTAFNQGLCSTCGKDNTKCAPFGLNADRYPLRSRHNVVLYFNTGSTAPFSRCHYIINVRLANPLGAKAIVNGNPRMSINGEKGNISAIQMAKSVFGTRLLHGHVGTFLLTSETNLGKVKEINFHWDYIVNLFDLSSWCLDCNTVLFVESISISLLNSYPESNRMLNTFTACSSTGHVTAIVSGSSSKMSVGKTDC